ncbi:MAG: DMT family transporter [Acidobacteriota bacterium]|nr:DMT family transporter [Acidobacteriota bacterium]
MSKPPARWRADLLLALVALLWGSTFVVVKDVLGDISTMYFLALRFAVASLCLFVILLPALRRAGATAVWRGLRGGFVAGIFLWLGFLLQTFGLRYTTAGNSGFITGLYIVLVPLIAAAAYRRWPKAPELGGVGIAAIGMTLLTLPSLHGGSQFNVGDLLTAACAVAFAIHLLLLGYFSQRERFEAVALGQIVCACVLSTLSLPIEHPAVIWSGRVFVAILVTGLFATALAFTLQSWAQQYTTPTRTAVILALEPVFALATAVLVGGEALTVSSVAGGALILGGILLVELKPGSMRLQSSGG